MVRIAIVDKSKCTREQCGYVCIKYCPGVRMGDETITKDGEGFPLISETLCTGCGICPKKCPVGALKIINLLEEKGKLVFQYGANAFRLYNLPLPKKNAVVGLIGANGMGKSTALKILSGKLKPNLGKYDQEETDLREIISQFKGQEIQNYFLELDRGARVSYKLQNVGKIAEVFDGTVREMLKLSDERKIMLEAVKTFELEACLDRKIGVLSGGELQRAAICAAFMRSADVYYFDEPSSYLDIRQRMKIARHIKGLAEQEGKSVIVVEHDLAVLDYMSEYIQVFYGCEGAYGVVSSLKGVRNGINEYLEGFLKDENVKFRDYRISFEARAAGGESKGAPALTYEAMEKTYGGFHLSCLPGDARTGEIIGIVGENAIGKSSFIKLLAGVEKPDIGEAPRELKISYKPQYVESDFTGTVGELFADAKIDREVFENHAKRVMDVGELMDKKVGALSGGELQRVAISLCASQPADIYLFDEPSAFLDIEQRLRFADMLKKIIDANGKIAFVVDHDIVLVDAISSRLIVFDGEPGVRGVASNPREKREGMNKFLKAVDITLRRDKDTTRPRVNKPGSVMDREQKESGEYYYLDSEK